MIFFKFIFYRFYSFYNKRWPKSDPEINAWYFVFLGIIYWFLAILIMLSNLPPTAVLIDQYMNWGGAKPTGIIFVILIAAFFYRKFLLKDRYLLFCSTGYFEKTIFNNKTITEIILWLYMLTPLLLIILGIVIKKLG